eukprot:7122075-Lingulodinium_polyedra.AAC.1
MDRALANRRARTWVVGAGLRWDLGIATHAALQIDLSPTVPEPVLTRAMRPSIEGEAVQG